MTNITLVYTDLTRLINCKIHDHAIKDFIFVGDVNLFNQEFNPENKDLK